MAQKPCPICGKLCRVTNGGKQGYCKTHKKRWALREVNLADILRGGPLRHESLPQPLLEIARWTHGVVGRFVQPTFEQWELGFLQDLHPERELGIWARVANAYVEFQKSRDWNPQTTPPEVGAYMVGQLLQGGEAKPTPLERCKPFTKATDSVRRAIAELNEQEVLDELNHLIQAANGVVPTEYIDSVEDEPTRELLRLLNKKTIE